MSRLKAMIQSEPVHERRVEIKSYPINDDRVVVEGWLRDERLVDAYHWDGRDRPAGVVHWMCVRMLIGEWPLKILDAEAEMPGIPHDLCRTTLDSIKKIVGMPIVAGYTEEVKRRLGGIEGCAHLTYLIMTMGPAALHGFWTQRSRVRRAVPTSLEDMEGLQYLINSCQLWQEDGPLMEQIKKVIPGKSQ
jgi:hypothetical protein